LFGKKPAEHYQPTGERSSDFLPVFSQTVAGDDPELRRRSWTWAVRSRDRKTERNNFGPQRQV